MIVIPEQATLSELRELLANVTNQISSLTPKLAKYRIDETNAKNKYNRMLAAAKVKNMNLGVNATMINALATVDPDVKRAQLEHEEAKAILEMGNAEFDALKEVNMSIKKSMGTLLEEIHSFGG